MAEVAFLKELVVVFGAAVLVVAVLRRLGVPPIAGLILTGVAAGPAALGLVHDTHDIDRLAEIGVVLLLFGIGLELSLDKLRRIWKAVIIGGTLQVGASVLITAVAARAFGLPWTTGVFVGCIVAVSSTAIVLRGLSARGELETPHGRLALGILVFQDLSVVPMIVVVPFLAGGNLAAGDLLRAAGVSIAALAGVLIAARLLVPHLLQFVAKVRERDLFVLTVFLICFGTAWLVSHAGISLALGAFLAGLVVAGSEFRHQAMSELIPAREVMASLFMVSVGMLVDVGRIGANTGAILGLLAAILVGKFVIILLVASVLRLPLRVGILTAAALSQIGEFSFVLLRAASGTTLVPAALEQDLLVAIVASMVLTPLALQFGPHLAAGASRVPWLNSLLGIRSTSDIDGGTSLAGHVVIAGYGLAGRTLATALREIGVPYVILDLNPDNVRDGRMKGEPMLLADVTRPEGLHEISLASARQLVVAINDPNAGDRAVRAARHEAPNLPILVRCQYASDIEALYEAGATQVISMELEGANRVAEWAIARLTSPVELRHHHHD